MKKNSIDIKEQVNFIRNAYSTTTIMPGILSEHVLTRLQNNVYSYEETELLCEAIMEKYDKPSPGILAMVHWIIECFYNSDIIPLVVSKDLIAKLEDDGYTGEEIEFLYVALTEKYDKMLGI